jgi:protein required for attachment to host cells
MRVDNGTWVAVCDGGKFLLLQNNGDADLLDLRVVSHEEIDTKATQGRENRGPSPDGHKARVGRAQSTDVEDLAEHRFVQSTAAALDKGIQKDGVAKLVLVADPKTLGRLRTQLSDQARNAIVHEISGDHAHKALAEIEKVLKKA